MNKKEHFPIPNIFPEERDYLKPKELFYFLFGEICSLYTIHNCKVEDAFKEKLLDTYSKNEMFESFINTDVYLENNNTQVKTYYILNKNLILLITYNDIVIFYKEGYNAKEFQELKDLILSYNTLVKVKEPCFYMIFDEYGGLELKEFKSRIVKIDLNTHYNNDFAPVHEKIYSFLNGKNSGLVLLHGKPGTGKTSYMRYLINNLEKKLIYLPADLVESLSKPNFLPFMSSYTDSIFIIEDCEELLFQRTSSNKTNSALLNLLNMSDGLIGDGFKVKFLCIFNTPITNIDKSLLRKGRLISKYEFKELETDKANKLIESEGLNIPKVTKPITLADIYHYDSLSNEPIVNKVGFTNSLQ